MLADLTGRFGMMEMEVAAEAIVRDRKRYGTVVARITCTSTNKERIGFTELIALGWLYRAGRYNGEFLGTDDFWERVEESEAEKAVRKEQEKEVTGKP